jgi:hypothetical protein
MVGFLRGRGVPKTVVVWGEEHVAADGRALAGVWTLFIGLGVPSYRLGIPDKLGLREGLILFI